MAIQTDPALAGPAHEAQRGQQIHQIIEKSFDFPYMAKDALGSAYGKLSGGQRQEFIGTFSYLFPGLLHPHGSQVPPEREHHL